MTQLVPDERLGVPIAGGDTSGAGAPAEAPSEESALSATLARFGIHGGRDGLTSHPEVRALIDGVASASVRQAVLAGQGPDQLLITADRQDDGTVRLTVGLHEPETPPSMVATELETLLQDVIDWVPATLSIKDTDRRYLFVNRYWETFAGMTRDQVIGSRFEDLNPANMDAGTIGAYGDDIRDGDRYVLTTRSGIHNREERYIDRTGRDRTMLNHRVPLFRPDGELLGVLSITVDITERKQKEHGIVRARDAAEAADRAKSQFLSVVSHELRTPMQTVLGLAQLGVQSGGGGKATAYFQTIESHARRLDGLIGEILEFSLLEGGGTDLSEGPFDPSALVEEVIAECGEALNGKPLALQADIDKAVPREIVADRRRLREILFLLLRNAVKFTDVGTIRLQMSAETSTRAGCSLRVEIEDTGSGIPADRQAAIFDPFWQADSSESRRYDGIGLGLSIGRRLVQSMGGEIGAGSRPGAGSRFWFAIPVKAVIPSQS